MSEVNSARTTIKAFAVGTVGLVMDLLPLGSGLLLLLWQAFVLKTLWGWYMGFTGIDLDFKGAVGICLVAAVLFVREEADSYGELAVIGREESEGDGKSLALALLLTAHAYYAIFLLVLLGVSSQILRYI